MVCLLLPPPLSCVLRDRDRCVGNCCRVMVLRKWSHVPGTDRRILSTSRRKSFDFISERMLLHSVLVGGVWFFKNWIIVHLVLCILSWYCVFYTLCLMADWKISVFFSVAWSPGCQYQCSGLPIKTRFWSCWVWSEALLTCICALVKHFVHCFTVIDAGTFTMDRDRCNVPCLFYATFNNKIVVHYNIRLSQIGTSNLFHAMQQLCSARGVECPGKGSSVYSVPSSAFVIIRQCRMHEMHPVAVAWASVCHVGCG